MSNNGADFFTFRTLLEKPLTKDEVWNDLADASDAIIIREVEERRRRLKMARDSVKNRKGDIISQILYMPESDKPAVYIDTGLAVTDINVGDTISKALVVQVINNGNAWGIIDGVDYFNVQFVTPTGKTAQWLLPTTAPQERSQLIKNAYLMGFDYFNTNLSNKDYERMYEFLGMFWPDNGFNDNFIHFIGFIKNLKLDMVPLWSIDDGTDYLNVLEVDTATHIHASQGGPWFLTSHVEVRYDIALQNTNLYPINFDEFVELFYLFAPIMLVLERIVGIANVYTSVNVGIAVQVEIINYGINSVPTDSYYPFNIGEAVQMSVINYGLFGTTNIFTVNVDYSIPIGVVPSTTVVCYGIFEDFTDWQYMFVYTAMDYAVNTYYKQNFALSS